jgi:pyruvate dehydrogenase E2 component (dihydrolipoamide acetyltransferase)
MATDIVMPRLSDSMEEGTILGWMKSVGDQVELGDELVEIETDKANMVFESDAAGTLVEIVAGEGDTLPIGEVIARVGEPDEASADGGGDGDGDGDSEEGRSAVRASPPSAAGPRVRAADAPPEVPAPAPSEPSQAPPSRERGERIKASPLARRMAEERGIDLASVTGSGPGGRIIKADVEAAPTDGAAPAEAPARAPAPAAVPAGPTPGAREKPETARGEVEVVELTRTQQTIARRMAESKATAPSFYLQSNIDMSRCFEARAQIKAASSEGEVVPSFNDMVVKACAIALRDFPRANGAYRDGKWELYERVNVGIAVARPDALIVPTIFDADRKGLRQIATEAKALASRVRDGSITPPELSGATFTVSNLGMYGISNFHPIINSPQAAILGVGEITPTPVVRDGELQIAQMMGVSLVCDHRILYGAEAAEFLARVRALLTEPLGLAL